MNPETRNKWKEVIEALDTDDLQVVQRMINKELARKN